MLTPSGVDGSHTWKKKQDRLPHEKPICLWPSTKLGRQKIVTFCFVALGRCLLAIIAPLLAWPQTVALCLALSLSLSQVSLFTFVLTCLSSIVMGTKGMWWELDGNKKNLMRIVWELDNNKRILMGYWWENRKLIETWWEQKKFDGLLMGTRGIWWELFGFFFMSINDTKGFWWEQEEFDGNYLGTWWEIKHPPFQKDNKHPLRACLRNPIGSPVRKNKKHP
jgi:hypothetical protein